MAFTRQNYNVEEDFRSTFSHLSTRKKDLRCFVEDVSLCPYPPREAHTHRCSLNIASSGLSLIDDIPRTWTVSIASEFDQFPIIRP